MKVPTSNFTPILLIIICCIFSVIACKSENSEHSSATIHTCPMHPQISQARSGTCPICGMDLVPITSVGSENEIHLNESQIAYANISTKKIQGGQFSSSKVLNARITANPESSESITARYSGRIEQLFIKETGRTLGKGAPLYRIYSEELQSLQQDYLLQLRQVAAFPNEKLYSRMLEAARNKLILFGFSTKQLNTLKSEGKPASSITVYSRVSGVINEVNVTEGQYVSEGSSILRIENYNNLWLEADLYPEEMNTVKIGTSLQIRTDALPEFNETVRVNFISPEIDVISRTIKIRANILNKGGLQPGMQATALLQVSDTNSATSVPLEAVIRDGSGTLVWVKNGKGTFQARKVITGAEDEQQILIIDGLEGVNEVVVSGAYLLNSEFILKRGKAPIL